MFSPESQIPSLEFKRDWTILWLIIAFVVMRIETKKEQTASLRSNIQHQGVSKIRFFPPKFKCQAKKCWGLTPVVACAVKRSSEGCDRSSNMTGTPPTTFSVWVSIFFSSIFDKVCWLKFLFFISFLFVANFRVYAHKNSSVSISTWIYTLSSGSQRICILVLFILTKCLS